MKVDIGIIGAMEPEVEALIAALEDGSVEQIGSLSFHIGKIDGKRVGYHPPGSDGRDG